MKKKSCLLIFIIALSMGFCACVKTPAGPAADAGLNKPAQTSGLPLPTFPLTEEAVMEAMARTGLPGVISKEETFSSVEGHISYTLRDPEKTYGDTENEVVTVGVSSAFINGERLLSLNFFSDTFEPGTHPFAWEDWKRQAELAALLYGGFENEEELYLALSDQMAQAKEDSFQLRTDVAGVYCVLRYRTHDTKIDRGNVLMQRGVLDIQLYESEAVYESRLKKT